MLADMSRESVDLKPVLLTEWCAKLDQLKSPGITMYMYKMIPMVQVPEL